MFFKEFVGQIRRMHLDTASIACNDEAKFLAHQSKIQTLPDTKSW